MNVVVNIDISGALTINQNTSKEGVHKNFAKFTGKHGVTDFAEYYFEIFLFVHM